MWQFRHKFCSCLTWISFFLTPSVSLFASHHLTPKPMPYFKVLRYQHHFKILSTIAVYSYLSNSEGLVWLAPGHIFSTQWLWDSVSFTLDILLNPRTLGYHLHQLITEQKAWRRGIISSLLKIWTENTSTSSHISLAKTSTWPYWMQRRLGNVASH